MPAFRHFMLLERARNRPAPLADALIAASDNADLRAAPKDYVKGSTAAGLALSGKRDGAAEQPYDDAF